jgi:fatty acid desaturase
MRGVVAGRAPANGALAGGAIALLAAALFLVPLAVHAHPAWGLALVPITLASNTCWSLLHEAIHGLLLADRRANDAVGRALAVVFAAPFGPLRIGHLLHHRYSRSPRERTEVFDPTRKSRWRAAAAYYPRLLGGMYATEMLASAAALLPARALAALERRLESDATVAHLVVRGLRTPRVLAALRLDAAAIVAAHVASFSLYGQYGWMLAAALAARAFLISFADNAYHYGTRLDAPRAAKNVRAPRWLELALLDFTLHGVHHRHPALPWHALRARFEADGDAFDERWLACLLRQLRGPISADRLPAG